MKKDIVVKWQTPDGYYHTLYSEVKEVVEVTPDAYAKMFCGEDESPCHHLVEGTPMYRNETTVFKATPCTIHHVPDDADTAKLELLDGTGRIVHMPLDKLREFRLIVGALMRVELCPAEDLIPADTNRLKAFRVGAGLSRAEASRQSGISLRTLEDWESGKRIPQDVDLLRKLAKLYGCYIEDLIGGDTDD